MAPPVDVRDEPTAQLLLPSPVSCPPVFAGSADGTIVSSLASSFINASNCSGLRCRFPASSTAMMPSRPVSIHQRPFQTATVSAGVQGSGS